MLKSLSPDQASELAGRAFTLFGPLLSRYRRADANLGRVFPEMSATERKRTLKAMCHNLGRVFGELPHMEAIINDPERITVEGLDEVREVLGDRKAALLLSAHYGNWEVSVAAGRRVGLKQANIYRPVKNDAVDRIIAKQREPVASAALIAKGQDTMKEIVRHLRRGIAVGMMVDQRERRGILAPFLGFDAWTLHAPALISQRLGVPVILGVAHRTEGTRFVVKCKVIPATTSGDRAADALLMTQAINEQLSIWIREHPDQWSWFHDRWAGAPT
ncbi:MAG: lysophospholipid acyltransferase family protein [Pseudomonadota bacterium]